jgi:hypothetical protein
LLILETIELRIKDFVSTGCQLESDTNQLRIGVLVDTRGIPIMECYFSNVDGRFQLFNLAKERVPLPIGPPVFQ